jgi:hypothetical protein
MASKILRDRGRTYRLLSRTSEKAILSLNLDETLRGYSIEQGADPSTTYVLQRGIIFEIWLQLFFDLAFGFLFDCKLSPQRRDKRRDRTFQRHQEGIR